MTTGTAADVTSEVWSGFSHDATGNADPLSLLEAYAQTGNGTAFARQAAEIAWHMMGPRALAQAVRLALTAEAPLTARQLSAQGHRLYPEDAELAKMARILAPPKVLGSRPAKPEAGRDLAWLRDHGAAYRGQWIALKDGEFIAAAPSAQALKKLLPNIRGIFVTRVG